MSNQFAAAADPVLVRATTGNPAVPGVIAGATDRNGMIFHGAAGVRALGHDAPMTTDTVVAIFSCTKAITGTAVMQLVEDGRLDLDAPAANYVPDLARTQVLEGFDDDGKPRLRAPKRPITARHLMLHTAGFGYEIFNERLLKYAEATGQESVTTGKRAALAAPLLFDPGDAWEYGINIDWCGQIVEAIAGKPLGDVLRERVFLPCGMDDMSFSLTDDMRARLAGMHQRAPDGTLSLIEGFELPAAPEVQMGGHGLYGTVGDYCRFIRMYLNDGDGGEGRVLKPETVRLAETNGLGNLKVRVLPGVIKNLSNDAEFFPGLSKSWSLSFMVNDEAAPTGRPAGALGWAGLANLFFWIDRKGGVGGFWATQILPFGDPASFTGYMGFETAIYEAQAAQRRAA